MDDDAIRRGPVSGSPTTPTAAAAAVRPDRSSTNMVWGYVSTNSETPTSREWLSFLFLVVTVRLPQTRIHTLGYIRPKD